MKYGLKDTNPGGGVVCGSERFQDRDDLRIGQMVVISENPSQKTGGQETRSVVTH